MIIIYFFIIYISWIYLCNLYMYVYTYPRDETEHIYSFIDSCMRMRNIKKKKKMIWYSLKHMNMIYEKITK